MSRSKILKDYVSGESSLEVTLKRILIIISSFNDEKLNYWVKKEIEGYEKDDELPEYRKLIGSLKGSYIQGNMFNAIQVSNQLLPTTGLPEELLNVNIYDSVKSITDILNTSSESTMGRQIPIEFCGKLSELYGASVTEATVICNRNQIQKIIDKVNSMVLDMLIKLENEFGNLDELDISKSMAIKNNVDTIKGEIICMIYNDQSISIGDKNKIKNTDIISNVKEWFNGNKNR
ncbi:hypothetical protein [uncultured Clostridium sp.]|uniref:AbiTii domain-containing protein n=1 Tax=uncultured Clostridium sp. TaxID=59620 RepID=UPI0025896A69|nr:hypothetical protein [uncultured Clostridium sp.]